MLKKLIDKLRPEPQRLFFGEVTAVLVDKNGQVVSLERNGNPVPFYVEVLDDEDAAYLNEDVVTFDLVEYGDGLVHMENYERVTR